MSDLDWDAEDYEPLKPTVNVVTDKWEGEDEDDVKDAWDNEDDEEKQDKTEEETNLTNTKKKKKKLADVIAEKEKRKLEELERRKKEQEELKSRGPEEILAEKLRIQKVQEDSDLQIATDLLGSKEKLEISLESFDLSTENGLTGFRLEFIRRLKTIDNIEKKSFYIQFLEDLCRDLCMPLESDDIKRITTILNAVYNDKVKASKPTKGKKKAGKAKLNTGLGALVDDVGGEYDAYADYDDFM